MLLLGINPILLHAVYMYMYNIDGLNMQLFNAFHFDQLTGPNKIIFHSQKLKKKSELRWGRGDLVVWKLY